MFIGIDFDNTIVCYDQVFHKIACEKGLISPSSAINKTTVRNTLIDKGLEDVWTEIQGLVYGKRILEASPFPGVLTFFQKSRKAGIPLAIISHKTRYPYLGDKVDLHQAAHHWLSANGFFDESGPALKHKQLFFEQKKEEKLARIALLKCSHFIDDLPEFLSEPMFPSEVERLLFSPQHSINTKKEFAAYHSWHELKETLLHKPAMNPV